MRDGIASKTAQHNALFRALEHRRSGTAPGLDPFAAGFLSGPLRCVEIAARTRPGRATAVACIDRGWPGVRTSVVARTALIDDLVVSAVEDVDQVVILGAGYDSRAHRLTALRHRAVYEVDHPATQTRKRARLAPTATANDAVRYVAVDFQRDRLDTSLRDAGYDHERPTLFLWEGVTNYLTEAAVDQTVRWCAGAARGSQLIFTYVDRHVLVDPSAYHGARRVIRTSRRAGEPLTFGLSPAETAKWLRTRGLRLVTDRGAAEYREQHYGPAAHRMRGHEFYRVAHAVRAEPASPHRQT